MFIDNKYTKLYYSIINRSLGEKRIKTSPVNNDFVYYENHHIIPKSLGGSNDKDNLVLLTAKEHYICHLLLTKMTEGKNRMKMWNAVHRIIHGHQKKHIKVSARVYEHSRNIRAKTVSNMFKGKPLSEDVKKKMSKSKKGKMTDEHKAIVSKTHKGKTPWNKGKKGVSAETSEKISASKRGKKRKPFSSEWKQKMSESRKGITPINRKEIPLDICNEIIIQKSNGKSYQTLSDEYGYSISVIRRILRESKFVDSV